MIKVLIVEDDPMVAMLNTHYLEQVGDLNLHAVNSVKSAIEIRKSQEICYLIFLCLERFRAFNVYPEPRKKIL